MVMMGQVVVGCHGGRILVRLVIVGVGIVVGVVKVIVGGLKGIVLGVIGGDGTS
jgi:hypothetical protein